MTHDLIIQLQYQLAVFQYLLERMQEQLAQETPTLEDALALGERIRQQREVSQALVSRANIVGGIHKPTISLN